MTRVPNERNVPTRVAAEGSRRNATEYRTGSPTSRHDSGERQGGPLSSVGIGCAEVPVARSPLAPYTRKSILSHPLPMMLLFLTSLVDAGLFALSRGKVR